MRLSDLFRGIATTRPHSELKAEVSDLTLDSRRVLPGAVFFALPGARTDGNRFIRQAVAKGAAAVVSELGSPPAPISLTPGGAAGQAVVWIQVTDVFDAMARASATFFGDPSAGMTVIGVTGTNGKTTVTYLLESIISRSGGVPGVIGTVSHRLRHRSLEQSVNTTPISLELTRLLARMKGEGATHVAMEVSSHALAGKRVDAVNFDAAVITNLHSDHLDFHKTREAYFAAKARLFELLERTDSSKTVRVAILNRDDESYAPLRRRSLEAKIATFGRSAEADYRAEGVVLGTAGTTFRINSGGRNWAAKIQLIGEHNVSNALAAAAAAAEIGIPTDRILEGLAALDVVPGRLESIREGQGFTVFTDYAHTTKALAMVLDTLGRLPHRRLITVFGCGGSRDKTKRGPMGAAAAAGSDLAIATSDNPRDEDPMDILRQVEAGIREGGRENYKIVPDRKDAIREAIGAAQEGDIVLIAGRGHEDKQILKDRTIDFSDKRVAIEALKDLGKC